MSRAHDRIIFQHSLDGDCFAYSQDLRLLDVFLPEDMAAPGPCTSSSPRWA